MIWKKYYKMCSFLTDEDMTTSVVGIGLPEPISTKSESLGNRKRLVSLYDISLNRVVVRFLESDTFYVLERRCRLLLLLGRVR
jgi:hypothetical protein